VKNEEEVWIAIRIGFGWRSNEIGRLGATTIGPSREFVAAGTPFQQIEFCDLGYSTIPIASF
jgi:hypothetical protein